MTIVAAPDSGVAAVASGACSATDATERWVHGKQVGQNMRTSPSTRAGSRLSSLVATPTGCDVSVLGQAIADMRRHPWSLGSQPCTAAIATGRRQGGSEDAARTLVRLVVATLLSGATPCVPSPGVGEAAGRGGELRALRFEAGALHCPPRCTILCMDELASTEFRKCYAQLQEETLVTANGRVIGMWSPVRTEVPVPVPAETMARWPSRSLKASSQSVMRSQAKRDELLRKINRG